MCARNQSGSSTLVVIAIRVLGCLGCLSSLFDAVLDPKAETKENEDSQGAIHQCHPRLANPFGCALIPLGAAEFALLHRHRMKRAIFILIVRSASVADFPPFSMTTVALWNKSGTCLGSIREKSYDCQAKSNDKLSGIPHHILIIINWSLSIHNQ